MRDEQSARENQVAQDPGRSADIPPKTKTFGLKFGTNSYEMTTDELTRSSRFILALYGDLSAAVRRAAENGEKISVAVDELDELEQNIVVRLNKPAIKVTRLSSRSECDRPSTDYELVRHGLSISRQVSRT